MTRTITQLPDGMAHPARSGGQPRYAGLLAAICCAFISWPAQGDAAALTAEKINTAEFSGKQPAPHELSSLSVRLEVLLARAHFSSGEIDGKFGDNARKALHAYADAQQFGSGDQLTPEVWQKLTADNRAALTTYQITARDVAGPFLARLPHKMEQMKHLSRLAYTGPREELAEKFHMSQELLSALNPGQEFRHAGATITVIDAATATLPGKADHVDVDKTRQTVKVFDASNQLLDFYPATVGSDEKPSPSGTLKVTSIDHNPTYRYNPAYHFKGVHARSPFIIRPGPNNPVGTVWIGLSGEGYGMHGTSDPSKVSKAASHGCVRLTNWDAQELAQEVSKGMPVNFVDKSG